VEPVSTAAASRRRRCFEAEVANLVRRSEEFGIDVDGTIEADMDAIVERKDDIVESIREGAYENVEDNENITFVGGRGVFGSRRESRVRG
jgi:pyruvate/2-oxoglutarate dehydrogenase complex dihydrolipoamide dehydrogenase (E3) component